MDQPILINHQACRTYLGTVNSFVKALTVQVRRSPSRSSIATLRPAPGAGRKALWGTETARPPCQALLAEMPTLLRPSWHGFQGQRPERPLAPPGYGAATGPGLLEASQRPLSRCPAASEWQDSPVQESSHGKALRARHAKPTSPRPDSRRSQCQEEGPQPECKSADQRERHRARAGERQGRVVGRRSGRRRRCRSKLRRWDHCRQHRERCQCG